MKCPKCDAEIEENVTNCPYCGSEVKELEKQEERTNADCLNFMANLNIVLSIISAIAVWVNFSTIEVIGRYTYETTTKTNWFGIIGGFGILIAGFTLFFLLKTIVDIYNEVQR